MSTLKTVCHFFFDNLSRCAFFAKQQVFKRIISAFAEYIPTGVEGLGFNSLPDKCQGQPGALHLLTFLRSCVAHVLSRGMDFVTRFGVVLQVYEDLIFFNKRHGMNLISYYQTSAEIMLISWLLVTIPNLYFFLAASWVIICLSNQCIFWTVSVIFWPSSFWCKFSSFLFSSQTNSYNYSLQKAWRTFEVVFASHT